MKTIPLTEGSLQKEGRKKEAVKRNCKSGACKNGRKRNGLAKPARREINEPVNPGLKKQEAENEKNKKSKEQKIRKQGCEDEPCFL